MGSNESNVLDQEDYQAFIYELDGKLLVFQRLSENFIMKCPRCKAETRYMMKHITKNPTCQNIVSPNEFKLQFNIFKAEKLRQDNAERKRESRAKLRAENYEAVKRQHRNHQASSMAKLRAEDNEAVKRQHRHHQASSIAKLRAEDNKAEKTQQKNRKACSRTKLRAEDNEAVKMQQKKSQSKQHGKTES